MEAQTNRLVQKILRFQRGRPEASIHAGREDER
jgi:hypothetical protein